MRIATSLGLLALVALFQSVPAAVATSIKAAELPQIVHSAKILSSGYDSCSGVIKGDQAHITVPRNPRENEKDLKINTILIAKSIMDRDPAIKLVRVYFVERTLSKISRTYDEKYYFIDASSAIVKSFASGLVDKDELLASMSTQLYTNASTMLNVVASAVGPGAFSSARLSLHSELRRLSGADESESDQIMPTVDQFANRMKAINEMAHLNKPKDAIKAQIDALDRDLKAEIARWNRFVTTNPEAARKQVESYKVSHGLKRAEPKQPSRSTIPTGVGSVSQNSQQYALLTRQFPRLAVDQKVPEELPRRQGLSLYLMQLSANGRCKPEYVDEFVRIENAARNGDRVALRSLLMSLENRVQFKTIAIPPK